MIYHSAIKQGTCVQLFTHHRKTKNKLPSIRQGKIWTSGNQNQYKWLECPNPSKVFLSVVSEEDKTSSVQTAQQWSRSFVDESKGKWKHACLMFIYILTSETPVKSAKSILKRSLVKRRKRDSNLFLSNLKTKQYYRVRYNNGTPKSPD